MNPLRLALLLWFSYALFACGDATIAPIDAEPLGPGPHAVGSTNMEVAPEFADIGDDAMHGYLLGQPDGSGEPRFVADILAHPESAWVIDVAVPQNPNAYGPASGESMPVVSFVAFPSSPVDAPNEYAFPYQDAAYGTFEDMLAPGEEPSFADPDARYPLIILSHGMSAHGVYDVRHAHSLASHGFIVAVIGYGDDRTLIPDDENRHLMHLRTLMTRAVLDSLLDSETFGPHIDADNIGISGHSFGGFTTLAIAGGPYDYGVANIVDERITAGVIAAPWVGGHYDGEDVFGFGANNKGLQKVDVPIISLFGTSDDVTLASFILPAMKQLSGPTYVIELVDQPHVFEQGSWEDRDAWELWFFNAYLKQDATALKTIRSARSMKGGNEDVQLFEYQSL